MGAALKVEHAIRRGRLCYPGREEHERDLVSLCGVGGVGN